MSGIRRTPADTRFSKMVRERAGWKCQRCGSTPDPRGLHCAHMFTRRTQATRLDPDNAAALCYGCHQYLDSHDEEKRAFFRGLIGEDAFDALTLRAHAAGKEKRGAA